MCDEANGTSAAAAAAVVSPTAAGGAAMRQTEGCLPMGISAVGLSNFQFYRTGKNGAVKVFLPVKPLQLGKSDSV